MYCQGKKCKTCVHYTRIYERIPNNPEPQEKWVCATVAQTIFLAEISEKLQLNKLEIAELRKEVNKRDAVFNNLLGMNIMKHKELKTLSKDNGKGEPIAISED